MNQKLPFNTKHLLVKKVFLKTPINRFAIKTMITIGYFTFHHGKKHVTEAMASNNLHP